MKGAIILKDDSYFEQYYSIPVFADKTNAKSDMGKTNRSPGTNTLAMEIQKPSRPGLPEVMTPTMAYVPKQFISTLYEEDKALMAGTIFPELNKPYLGRPVM